jgi:hypothetical protein
MSTLAQEDCCLLVFVCGRDKYSAFSNCCDSQQETCGIMPEAAINWGLVPGCTPDTLCV